MLFNPLISVIIPIYNVERHLEKCLNSIVNQTYKNLEIILINDGSTDNSGVICEKYAENDSRVIYISRENKGVSASRNEGIELSHGDYFSFIDSDDYLELDAYEYLTNIIKEKNVDIVNYEHYVTFQNSEEAHQLSDKNYGLFDKYEAQKQLVYNVAFAWNKLFSKKTISGLKFDETILRGEDSLFSRQAFDKADFVWFDSRPLYHYVQSEESACRGEFRPSQLTAIKLYNIYDEFYSEKYPELLPKCIANLNTLMVSLYFDMWQDKSDFRKEKKLVYCTFKKYYNKAMACNELSKKQKLKMKIFKFSPTLFCLIHKFTK